MQPPPSSNDSARRRRFEEAEASAMQQEPLAHQQPGLSRAVSAPSRAAPPSALRKGRSGEGATEERSRRRVAWPESPTSARGEQSAQPATDRSRRRVAWPESPTSARGVPSSSRSAPSLRGANSARSGGSTRGLPHSTRSAPSSRGGSSRGTPLPMNKRRPESFSTHVFSSLRRPFEIVAALMAPVDKKDHHDGQRPPQSVSSRGRQPVSSRGR
jgi:hypothetical protein